MSCNDLGGVGWTDLCVRRRRAPRWETCLCGGLLLVLSLVFLSQVLLCLLLGVSQELFEVEVTSSSSSPASNFARGARAVVSVLVTGNVLDLIVLSAKKQEVEIAR
ncbi:hypothetical protein L596_017422 [Steinernema carpocapsae]|uniref:Uncharacterized protein n=1 Tax=Steinernema carpocapsae TaxID=34508 RepID=A0A4U5N1W2_STECR|nr:hypothetical protein L596_017422 [Steinernema carpocapsae]